MHASLPLRPYQRRRRPCVSRPAPPSARALFPVLTRLRHQEPRGPLARARGSSLQHASSSSSPSPAESRDHGEQHLHWLPPAKFWPSRGPLSPASSINETPFASTSSPRRSASPLVAREEESSSRPATPSRQTVPSPSTVFLSSLSCRC